MAAVTGGLWLVRSAVSYAIAAARPTTSAQLAKPTPCDGWDLDVLLTHVGDSMDVLSEAMTTGSVGPGPVGPVPVGPVPVGAGPRPARPGVWGRSG